MSARREPPASAGASGGVAEREPAGDPGPVPEPSLARARELRATLDYHAHRYYLLDDPEIADDT